jgi:hypothetical protein
MAVESSAGLGLLHLLEYVCGNVEDALCGLVTGCALPSLHVMPVQHGKQRIQTQPRLESKGHQTQDRFGAAKVPVSIVQAQQVHVLQEGVR